MNIQSELEKYLLTEVVFDDKKTIASDENLLAQEIIDSFGLFKLVAFMERKFGVSVPVEEMTPENFKTIQAISNLVDKMKTNGNNS